MNTQNTYVEEVQKILDFLEENPLGDLQASEEDEPEDVLAELAALQKE